MRRPLIRHLIRGFVSFSLLAFDLLGLPASEFKKGQPIYVVAVRDSRVLTICFPEGIVDLSGISVFQPTDMRAWGRQLPDCRWALHFPGSALTFLPVSAADSPECDRPLLERILPDPSLKSQAEKEFLKLKKFTLVDSPDKADYVFLVEGTHILMNQVSARRNGQVTIFGPLAERGRDANFLQTALAIVLPAKAYRENPLLSPALLQSRLWEGSSVNQLNRESRGLQPASVASLVRQLHNKEKRPAGHAPLCLPAGRSANLSAADSALHRAEPKLSTTEINPPIPSSDTLAAATQSQAIKVDVALVTVPALVTDGDGRFIPDLQVSDFRLLEDGVEQKIDRVIPASEPFNVALVLDTSGSTLFKLEDIKQAALAFVDALREDDRVMIVSFDSRIYLNSEFTANRDQLRSAILQTRTGGSTRLYDVVDLVTTERLMPIQGRKAMVLFTDGVDASSQFSSSAATLAMAEESDGLIYTIQYNTQPHKQRQLPSNPTPSGFAVVRIADMNELYAQATRYLQSLSARSGGRYFRAETLVNLSQAFAEIAEELRRQYTLCYYPANQAADGAYRRIQVQVNRPGAKVRARAGYRPGK